ncbi:unnamed protein product [Schistosoma guineensis]|nr:unnamed protein product [Schistosoma guineensis]
MSDNVHSSSRIFNDIMLSRRFTSWDNFETCLKEVHKYTHTKYVMSVCKKNSDDPTLKYFFVRYVCTYGRKRSSSESDACVQDVDDDGNNHSSEEHTTSNSPTQPRQRRRRRSSTYALLQVNLSFKSKYCHCKSGFWVRALNGELKLTSIKTVHNHPCTEGYISVDPSKRQLTSSERLYLRTFLLSNTPTRSLRYLVSLKFNKQLTKDDIARMRSQLYPDTKNINNILQRIQGKTEVKVFYENGNMSMICFSRREQIAVYHAFPEVICIDSTYQTNKVGFPLFQLVVTDSLGQGHTVMYALCSQERREDIEKLLECFKEIMCGTYATRTFIMDSAATEISAVQSTHSHSNIILCSFHVLRAFFRKFRNPDVRKCLEQLVKTRRSDIFTRKYEHLRTHFPRAYDYIKDYWIARKSMWARCYRRHVLSLGNHTNNRVESAHKHLKECLRRGDSLLLTFWKIWSKTDIDLRLRPYDAVKDLQRFPILPVPMSFRTLLNEFTSFAAKIVSVNYKRGHILYAHSKDLIRGGMCVPLSL